MEKFLIKGSKKLEGAVTITCSKNAYLPILAGCILSNKPIILHNCPKYVEIVNMIKILESLGGSVISDTTDGSIQNGCNLLIDCSNVNSNSIPHELASVIRSSIFSLGSILGNNKFIRFNFAKFTIPINPTILNTFDNTISTNFKQLF